MVPGFKEFEFDLPGALLEKLISIFETVEPAPLSLISTELVPDEQGVYQLFYENDDESRLVYIGKTDADAGLRKRLGRHAKKVTNRRGLAPTDVYFKAIRIFVFTSMDLETQLIDYYGGTASVQWNGSGFGSNDPGRERDTTKYKADHFDTQFPIDIDRDVDFTVPTNGTAAEILLLLKAELPYTLRYQNRGYWRNLHHDLVVGI